MEACPSTEARKRLWPTQRGQTEVERNTSIPCEMRNQATQIKSKNAALSLLGRGDFWCVLITLGGWCIAIANHEMSLTWACGSLLAGLLAAFIVPAVGNAIAKSSFGARYGAIAGLFFGLAAGDLFLGIPLMGQANRAGNAPAALLRLIGPTIGFFAGAAAGAWTQLLFRTIRESREDKSPKSAEADRSSAIQQSSVGNPRERLIKRIGDINNFELPRPLVTLEEFFEGNNDRASIGYNLPDQPSPQEFFTFFKSVRDREEVVDVLIEVKDLEDPAGWPATDTIWVVTKLPLSSLSELVPERFAPDEWKTYPPDYQVDEINVPPGMRAFAIWYD